MKFDDGHEARSDITTLIGLLNDALKISDELGTDFVSMRVSEAIDELSRAGVFASDHSSTH
jgi:hypothetical protein